MIAAKTHKNQRKPYHKKKITVILLSITFYSFNGFFNFLLKDTHLPQFYIVYMCMWKVKICKFSFFYVYQTLIRSLGYHCFLNKMDYCQEVGVLTSVPRCIHSRPISIIMLCKRSSTVLGVPDSVVVKTLIPAVRSWARTSRCCQWFKVQAWCRCLPSKCGSGQYYDLHWVAH